MSALTTDLRAPRCEALFTPADPFTLCLLAHHADGSHESVVAGVRTRWRTPMTPRRDPVEPLTQADIAYHVGLRHDVEYGRGPAGVPIVFIGGRPFREVT